MNDHGMGTKVASPCHETTPIVLTENPKIMALIIIGSLFQIFKNFDLFSSLIIV
jgi:hypothetical protein